MITYNEINKIANEINKKHNINIFEDTRKTKVVRIRFLFCYLLHIKHRLTQQSIADYFKLNGLKRDRSFVVHAVRTAKKEYNKEPYLLDIFYTYIKTKTKQKEEILSNKFLNIKDKVLHLFPDDLTTEQEKELIECIKLKIKSFKWKNQR